VSGVITPLNSLVGDASGDYVGALVIPLADSSFLISSPYWANGMAGQAGAVTWASGVSGIVGEVNAANSLVGSTANDQVGNGVTVLTNGNVIAQTRHWANGPAANAGAVTWGSGPKPGRGRVDA